MIRTLDEMVEAARQENPCVMAVAVAQDLEVLEAVTEAARLNLVRPVLVGDAAAIRQIAADGKLDLSACEIVDVPEKPDACMAAATLVRDGKASLLMKGFVDTAVVMKAILNKENALRTENLISHVGVMEVSGFDRLIYVTDSAMNIAPSLDDKAGIVKNAVTVAHALGNAEPKVAVLCAVEKVNEKMPSTVDAQELVKRNAAGEITGCQIGGPFALDNAVSEAAAKHKGIADPVAGKADILVAPNLEAGNILNKSMEYFAHARKAGVIVGARVPVVLTSRASSAQFKMYSIALGALIARAQKGGAA